GLRNGLLGGGEWHDSLALVEPELRVPLHGQSRDLHGRPNGHAKLRLGGVRDGDDTVGAVQGFRTTGECGCRLMRRPWISPTTARSVSTAVTFPPASCSRKPHSTVNWTSGLPSPSRSSSL